MKICSRFNLKYLINLFIFSCFIVKNIIAQPVAGLDNYFNHEISATTGKPFHYLWSDTAWSGFSRWGSIFTSREARLKSVGKPVAGELKDLDVYIIVDPDTTTESESPNYILPNDIRTIKKWTMRGGVLVIMANDAPNCEFTHLNNLASTFGITFNHVTLNPVLGDDFDSGSVSNLPDHPLFKGVGKIFLKEISDINLWGKARAVLTENGKVLMAETTFGKGYVFAVGDPWIYNEYIDHDRLPVSFDNRKAAENLTDILLSHARVKRK
jgi:unsaturated rhamnogalacturonyl hydrolase